MDPISNVDRLVMLLRQRLQERSRTGRGARPGQKEPPALTGMDNVQALATVEGIDDAQLGRALIQGILTEQFGSEMINDPQFQQLVDRVVGALQEDAQGNELLTRMVDELRDKGS